MTSKSEVQSMFNSLKVVLKSKGITYSMLARELCLSEASVKRMFSKKEMSIGRLGDICEIANLHFKDLVQISEANENLGIHIYTEAQELAFVKNPSLLAFLNHLLSDLKPKKIKEKHKLSWTKVRYYLSQLEKLGFIEVHPNDRVKFLIPKKVQWRKNGSLQRKLLPMALNEFLSSTFSEAKELKRFLNIKLSEQSIRRFQVQIDEFVSEVNKVSKIEQSINTKISEVGVLCAIRPWDFSVLNKII